MSELLDSFHRKINYLRLSVTERCNLNCFYCRPDSYFCKYSPNARPSWLSVQDYSRITQAFVSLGINKVRITGGEPLLYPGILNLVEDISKLKSVKDLSMTTNAYYLDTMAEQLANSGLHRVNISLDSLQGETFKKITRNGTFHKVWEGVEAAIENGLTPVKINVVLLKDINHQEVKDFARLTLDRPMQVRFIEFMPMGNYSHQWKEHFLSLDYVEKVCSTLGELQPVEGDHGAGPAHYFRIGKGRGKIGLITPLSRHFCSECNRLRVTAEGKIKPCLFSKEEIDLKPFLGENYSPESLQEIIKSSLQYKPNPQEAAGDALTRVEQLKNGPDAMNQIGG